MAQKQVTQGDFNLGGLAASLLQGANNSLAEIVGIDLHSDPGFFSARQKLTKDSGATIDEFCKCIVAGSNGKNYFFSSESGKIWIEDGGSYSLGHTTSATNGESKILGAEEYNGYLYWATQNWLHRCPLFKSGTFTSNVESNWAALNLDQEEIGASGENYTLETSINEGATHRQTVQFKQSVQYAAAIYITSIGAGDVTLTLHDSSNTSKASKTIANGSLSTGWNIFVFDTTFEEAVPGDEYHFHATVSSGTTTIGSDTASDHEGSYMRMYTLSSDEYHPMCKQNATLFIGDREFVHQVYNPTGYQLHEFSPFALDIVRPYKVKSLGKDPLGYDLLIGTELPNYVSDTELFVWNTWSESFSRQIPVKEDGINAFIYAGVVIVQAGRAGRLYYYAGNQLKPLRNLPGQYSPTKTAYMHPNASATLNGVAVFGFSGDDATNLGVYAYGTPNPGFPPILTLDYPISERDGDDFVLANIEIGAVVVSGYDMFVSWKNGSTVGVDKLDYDNKLNGAYIKTRAITLDRNLLNKFMKTQITYKEIPANCDVALKFANSLGGSFTNAGSDLKQDTNRFLYEYNKMIEGTYTILNVTLTVDGNNTPSLAHILLLGE